MPFWVLTRAKGLKKYVDLSRVSGYSMSFHGRSEFLSALIYLGLRAQIRKTEHLRGPVAHLFWVGIALTPLHS